MNKDHATLEVHLKKNTRVTALISIIISLCSGGVFVYGFYFDTRRTQLEHTQSILEIKDDVKTTTSKVNEAAIFQAGSQAEQKAIQDKVNVIEKKVDKLDDKLDRILMQTK